MRNEHGFDPDGRARIAVLRLHVVHLLGEALERVMTLPADALARLRALQEQLVALGDIWWIPEDLVKYPGGKDRFCLVVGIEQPTGSGGAVVHFVAGSTNMSRSKTIKVDRGACGLNEDTYFRFWWTGSIARSTLVESCMARGSLPTARRPEIQATIKASTLVQLKRFVP